MFSLFPPTISVTILMNQVCTISQLGRVGWDGFDKPPPTREDCLRAIENLNPEWKGLKEVIFLGYSFFKILSYIPFSENTYDSRNILQDPYIRKLASTTQDQGEDYNIDILPQHLTDLARNLLLFDNEKAHLLNNYVMRYFFREITLVS